MGRSFLSVLAFLWVSVALAQSDQLLCRIKTDRPLPEPKEFKVVELEKSGKGNSKALITRSFLSEQSELRVQADANGNVTAVVLAGAVIPVEKLVSPGISLQVSERHLGKDFTRDLIRMVATQTPSGCSIRVTTLKGAGVFNNPTWQEFWTVAKDSAGIWGLVYSPTIERLKGPVALPAGTEGMTLVESIQVKLTLKEENNPSKGFKGITEYTMVPRPKSVSEALAHSDDPRVITVADKAQTAEETTGAPAGDETTMARKAP